MLLRLMFAFAAGVFFSAWLFSSPLAVADPCGSVYQSDLSHVTVPDRSAQSYLSPIVQMPIAGPAFYEKAPTPFGGR